MSNDYYVYLLVDTDPKRENADRIFYVGKGRGGRALAHLAEFNAAIKAHELSKISDLSKDEEATLPDRSRMDKAEYLSTIHAKVARIDAIWHAGREVRVDLLRTEISSNTAFGIESAVIDTLGLENLDNKVAGHGHFRAPVGAVLKAMRAETAAFDFQGVQVSVRGAWGGGHQLSGLVDAEESDVWENARHRWAVKDSMRTQIDEAGSGESPRILVATAMGDRKLWGGLILGLWEIMAVQYEGPRTSERADGTFAEVDGYLFETRAIDSARILDLRDRFLGKRSPIPGQVGVQYINIR